MAQRLQGSPDLYAGRGPAASVNFITCHDGFTLYDLVSYNGKHNEANGEDNRDGGDDNNSWNCGAEGPSEDPVVNALRRRQVKNAVAMLLLSQGVPMLLMGDEMGRTQCGNNNTYCQDNERNWLDWRLRDANAELFAFVKHCVAFRMAHPALRSREHLERGRQAPERGALSWHGTRAWHADWSGTSRVLAFMLHGRRPQPGVGGLDSIYVAINMHWEPHWFQLPALGPGLSWRVGINTAAATPADRSPIGEEPVLPEQGGVLVGDRSVVVLVGR
jgi:isoamylase